MSTFFREAQLEAQLHKKQQSTFCKSLTLNNGCRVVAPPPSIERRWKRRESTKKYRKNFFQTTGE